MSVAGGAEPLRYQWRRNETGLAGETNATLTLTNVQLAQAGSYTVVVTDGFDEVAISEAAILTVDPAFTKVTTGSIVADGGDSRGVAWGDYDDDGHLDLFVANDNGQNDFLYRNNGDGTFARIVTAGIGDDGGNSAGCAWMDYDNDGHLDLFVANGFLVAQPNFLYRNNGDGSFARITEGILVTDSQASVGCSWGDYDNDGDVDVFVCDAFGSPNSLYQNNGDGIFTKVTEGDIPTDVAVSDTAGWGDYDNDGFLYRNKGNGTFAKVTEGPLVNDGGGSIGCAWGDSDNDGDLDLFVVHNGHNFLYRNDGDGTFTSLTEGDIVNEPGRSLACAWADYDNDGFLDVFVTNGGSETRNQRNFLYRNNGDGSFTKITEGSLVNDLGWSHGCAWGDYDNDGFLDLAVSNNGGEDNFLYRNNGNSNHWIRIQLQGAASNRSGTGAKIRVNAVIRGTNLWQLREISTGGGYNGSSLGGHFGLGDATTVGLIRIEWPSGILQELRNVAVNQVVTVTEPTRLRALAPLPSGAFQFEMLGGIGFRYSLERSGDLITWITWATVTNATRTIRVTDQSATNFSHRFYRARGF